MALALCQNPEHLVVRGRFSSFSAQRGQSELQWPEYQKTWGLEKPHLAHGLPSSVHPILFFYNGSLHLGGHHGRWRICSFLFMVDLINLHLPIRLCSRVWTWNSNSKSLRLDLTGVRGCHQLMYFALFCDSEHTTAPQPPLASNFPLSTCKLNPYCVQALSIPSPLVG